MKYTSDQMPNQPHITPIPVPYHCKAQVKADLDRDVRLGIIEPVPPLLPLYCLVLKNGRGPQKDDSTCRTVYLQSTQ